tara:strand:+ start:12479 stop:12754 length:276 start_codon:yes stop_codon:yes gene_type:complete
MNGPRHVSDILPDVVEPILELTPRQQDYVDYMARFFDENDQLPTLQVLAQHFVCYPNTAWCHMQALERKCVVEKNVLGKWKRGPLFPGVMR